jgi:hypothetical protein
MTASILKENPRCACLCAAVINRTCAEVGVGKFHVIWPKPYKHLTFIDLPTAGKREAYTFG